MNNWYNRINGAQASPSVPQHVAFQNPMQAMQYAINTVRNPAQFVKEQFPDIPDNIMTDPDAILRYLQRTRGINDQIIQNISGMYGRR